MAGPDSIVEAPFLCGQVGQCSFFGTVHGIMAVNARISLGAVVVDQQGGKTQFLVDGILDGEQRIAIQRLVKTLHQ
ncbi:hypothetical protein D3C80_1562060 [compost metagenome]